MICETTQPVFEVRTSRETPPFRGSGSIIDFTKQCCSQLLSAYDILKGMAVSLYLVAHFKMQYLDNYYYLCTEPKLVVRTATARC